LASGSQALVRTNGDHVKLLLNTKPHLRPINVETWGQWLDSLDDDSSKTGRIVTAVRFDDVDEPAFRASAIRARRLDAEGTMEVETAPRQQLVGETSQQGAIMLASLAEAAALVGDAFRQPDLSAAHAMLPQLVDGIRAVVALTDECAAALGVPRQQIELQGVSFDLWMDEFGRRLAILIDAQGAGDWLTSADSLEYEIAPSLREWVGAFEYLSAVANEGLTA
jgi:hypothetical protein